MANPLNHYLPRDRKVLYLAYLLRLSKQPLLTFANKDIPLRITCSDYTKKRALKHQEQERRKQNATRYLKESTQKLFINTSQRLKNKRIKRPGTGQAVKKEPVYVQSKKNIYRVLGNLYYPIGLILCALLTIPILWLYIQNFKLSFFRILLIIPLAVMDMTVLYRFTSWLVNIFRVRAHDASLDLSKAIIVRDGAPGAGKTSSLIYDMVVIAEKMWEKIKYEYWLLKPQWEKIHATGSLDEKRHLREICEAYEYYSMPHIINGKSTYIYPCLWSNIPIYVDGKPCSKFLFKHLVQEAKLPYGTVAVLDEISLMIPQELHRSKPIEIKEMTKFPRHFGDFHFGATEQEATNMFKDFRRSCAENKYMQSQKWVCQPMLLNRLFENLKTRWLEKEPTLERVNQLKAIDRLRSNIGFRQYSFYDRGNIEVNIEGTSRKRTFVLPCYLNADYDSRTFKNLYKAKDKPLIPSIWDNRIIPDKDLKEIFSPDIKEMCKSEKEKRKDANKIAKAG